ncbi:sialin-like isoform X2 [Ornithodoros turicata]
MKLCRIPGRYITSCLLFFGMTIISSHKFDLGIAIVAMVNGTLHSSASHNSSTDNSTQLASTDGVEHNLRRLSWSPSMQGIILGSYFYGVIIPQVFGGRLAERFSAKWMLGGGVMVSSMLCSATPWIATLGAAPLVVHRIILGLTHGLSMPAGVALVAQWAPKKERSTFMAVLYCGRYVGIVTAMLLFGHLSGLSVAGGWPFAFYISGVIGFVWSMLWCFLGYNDPAEDPKVDEEELRKIKSSACVGPLKSEKKAVPWKAVLLSPPVWALVAARFSNMWVSMLLFTKLPAYLESVLQLSLKQNGNLSSLVFAFTILTMLGSGLCADWLLRHGLRTTLVRKLFQLTANLGPAACLIGIANAGCDQWLVLCFLIIAKVTLGTFTGGNVPAVVDLAPMYSATLNGMITTFGQTTGVLAPLVAGMMTNETNPESSIGLLQLLWARVFYLSAGISIAGGLLFALFGSADKQPWGDNQYGSVCTDSAEEGRAGKYVAPPSELKTIAENA